MRILVDTNILFSALVFPRSKPAQALLYIADNHEIVLCDRNIVELRDILKRKAPKFLPDAEVLLAEMSYELIPAVDHAEKLIRQKNMGRESESRFLPHASYDRIVF